MQNANRHANSKENQPGFTLIELLIVFSLIGLLIVSSLVAFSGYQRTQTFQTSFSEFVQMLAQAKSRTVTQVKPPQCSSEVLRGYQVRVTPSGSTYQLEALCDNSIYIISTKQLPASVTFTASSQETILFNVSTGIVLDPGQITVSGFGQTKRATIEQTGIISVQ